MNKNKKDMRILVINPGSTSTKIAVYEDDKSVWMTGAHHHVSELAAFQHISDQYEYRKNIVLQRLADAGIDRHFDAVIGRGGLLHPLAGGVYVVNDKMKHDLMHAEREHACNLGALIAAEIADECGCPAYIADPVVVDEMRPEARYTGFPGVDRKSIFHALNQKAVARQYATSVGKKYEDMRLIVAHIGGGISVGAHVLGKVVDVNNALDGEGPFSPERAGTVPAGQLVDICFSGQYTKKQVKQMISGKGGLAALLGETDMITIDRKAEDGEHPYKEVIDAMMYTIAKQIGAMYVAMEGKAEAIILTGGIAHSDYCMPILSRQIDYLAPVVIMPGENEMGSLAYNALGVLRGELPLLEYE